ncbi:MAG: hypothetical protein IK051_11120 [Rhodocyclaceae bacterium]|nr:hypothetical protein [Rhodocyclaceae bacterium]
MDAVQNNSSLMNQAWQAIGAARNVQQQAATNAQVQPPVDRQGEAPQGVEVQISDAARQAQARDAMGETAASTDLSRAQMRTAEQTAPGMPQGVPGGEMSAAPVRPAPENAAAAEQPVAPTAAAEQPREHPGMQLFRATAGLGAQGAEASQGVREIA